MRDRDSALVCEEWVGESRPLVYLHQPQEIHFFVHNFIDAAKDFMSREVTGLKISSAIKIGLIKLH